MFIANMKMRSKFLLLVGSVSLIFILSMFFMKLSQDKIATNFTNFHDNNYVVSVLFDEIEDAQMEVVLNVRGLQIVYLLKLFEQVDENLAALNSAIDKTPNLLRKLEEVYIGDPAQLNKLKNLVSDFQVKTTAFAKSIKDSEDNKAPYPVFLAFVGAHDNLTTFFMEFQNQMDEQAKSSYNDTQQAISNANQLLYIAIFVATLAAILLSSYMSQVIVGTIEKVKNTAQQLAKGNLNVSSSVKGKDEISDLSTALDSTVEHLNKTLTEIQSSADVISNNSDTLLKSNVGIQTATTDVSDHSALVVTAIEELSMSSKGIAENTTESAVATKDIQALASQGMISSIETKNTVMSLVGSLKEAAEVVHQLRDESNKIESILDVIRSIAEQTNLLALNAAIEAARAGEQGRGFAVVADEVRTLAQRSQVSVNEIESMLSQLSSASGNAVRIMNDSSEVASSAEGKMAENNQMIEEIQAMIEKVNGQTQEIASAADEQSLVASDISANMHKVQGLINKTAEISAETISYSEEMSQVSGKVREQVKFFNLS